MNKLVKDIRATTISIGTNLQVPSYVNLPQGASLAGALVYSSAVSQMFYWDGSQWISLSAGGGSVNLSSAGTAESLVQNGSAPNLEVKSLRADAGITFDTTTPGEIGISADTGSLASTATGVSLVDDGVGPDFVIKGLSAGTGIQVTPGASGLPVQISGTYQLTENTGALDTSLISTTATVTDFKLRKISAAGAASINIVGDNIVIGASGAGTFALVEGAPSAGTVTSLVDPAPPANTGIVYSLEEGTGIQIGPGITPGTVGISGTYSLAEHAVPGVGQEGLVASTSVAPNFQLKNLQAGTGISLATAGDNVTITATAGGGFTLNSGAPSSSTVQALVDPSGQTVTGTVLSLEEGTGISLSAGSPGTVNVAGTYSLSANAVTIGTQSLISATSSTPAFKLRNIQGAGTVTITVDSNDNLLVTGSGSGSSATLDTAISGVGLTSLVPSPLPQPGPSLTVKAISTPAAPNNCLTITDNVTSVSIAGNYSLSPASSTISDATLVSSAPQTGPAFTVKSLRAGANITLDTTNANYVTIAASGGGGGSYTLNSVGTGASLVKSLSAGPAFEIKSVITTTAWIQAVSLTDEVRMGLESDANRNWGAGTGAAVGPGVLDSIVIGNSAGALSSRSIKIGGGTATGLNNVLVGVNRSTGVSSDNTVFIGSSSAVGSYQFANSVYVGSGVVSTIGDEIVCIGSASGAGFQSTAVGYDSFAAIGCLAYGHSAKVFIGATNSIAIGKSATAAATSSSSVVLGSSSSVSGSSSIAIGTGITISGSNTVAIGAGTTANEATLIGAGSTSADQCVAVGRNAKALSSNSVALGYNTTAPNLSVSVGHNAIPTGGRTVCVGQATVAAANGTAVGQGANAATTATALGQLAVAAASSIAIGQGVNNSLGNTGLIGSSGATADQFVLYSTGYFRATKPLSAKYGAGYGVTSSTQSVPTLTTAFITFPTLVYDYYPTSYSPAIATISVANDGMYLGGTNTDAGQIYNINFNCKYDVGISTGPLYFEIVYTPPTGAAFVIARVTGGTATAAWNSEVGVSFSVTQLISGAGIRPYVQVRVSNQTASTANVRDRSLTVSRLV